MPDASIPAWIDGRLVPVGKLEAHRRGLRHKAVSVFILDGHRTLLQCRAAGKYHTPGLWANACCTHPGMDESSAVCAARRLAEELGIAGLALTPRGQIEYRADVGDGLTEHEVVDLFTADAPPGLTLRPDPTEVSQTRWIALDALDRDLAARPDRYTPWLRIYMARHRDAIFGTPQDA